MDAVLFDMDGVVVDSERHWIDHERERLLPEAVEEPVAPEEITGMNVEDLYDYLAEEYTPRVDRDAFLDRYDAVAETVYAEQAALMDGFDAVVAAADERGDAVGLVTSSPLRWVEMVLDRFDLHGTFDAVVSAEQVDRGKPAPDVYRRAARELDADPAACLAVEDSAHGMEAARRAGMTVVAFGDRPGDAADADYVAADADELRAVL